MALRCCTWGIEVASGTKQVSIAIVDDAYAGYLAGLTSVTLPTSRQRFKITRKLPGEQTGLWIVVRQYDGNGDSLDGRSYPAVGIVSTPGHRPKEGIRTHLGVPDGTGRGEGCLRPTGSLRDQTAPTCHSRCAGPVRTSRITRLLVTSGGELIIAGSTGNGYRLAELMAPPTRSDGPAS